MIEINRHSKEVKAYTGHNLKNLYLRIENGVTIYFTIALVSYCDLKVGEYIHFLNEEADWKFYSNDNTDGFKLCKGETKGGLFLPSVALTRLILKSTGYNNKKIFYISKTKITHDKCNVFQLTP